MGEVGVAGGEGGEGEEGEGGVEECVWGGAALRLMTSPM